MTGVNNAGRVRRAAGAARAALLAVVRASLTNRARREFLFCLYGLVLGVPGPLAGLVVTLGGVRLLHYHGGAIGKARWSLLDAAVIAAVLLLALVASGAARGLAAFWRARAARLLLEPVSPAPPLPDGRLPARLAAAVRDGSNWRAAGYLVLKLPVGAIEGYAVLFWACALFDLTYPIWWPLASDNQAGANTVYTPVGWFGQGTFRSIASVPVAAVAVGVATLLVAPWVTRGIALADGWLSRCLLGPGKLERRVAQLDRARALAVDDSAATLRRLERDLHDGAQIRLATLAMNLGVAKKKLGDDDGPSDVASTRELIDTALQGAKDALVELRALVQGIHPPILDNGLADALATLSASSAIPVDLTVRLPARPTAAIETITYFCTAELLANAVKHSMADTITIDLKGSGRMLTLTVTDNGSGGAGQAPGSGLSGLDQRISTVNGRLAIYSPPGGPTQVTVTLPMQA
jgi:signal transduction histidine kinase